MKKDRSARLGRVVFITGTDTGVGKTVLTGLLLAHARAQGCHALALKPFCSGGREDVVMLQALQQGELRDEEMNPWFYPEPVAPWAAQRQRGEKVALPEVLAHVRKMASRCELLLVEGAGGLLAPLGPGWTALDLLQKMPCAVLVVAADRLGCLNHTMLTVRALESAGLRHWSIVLMGQKKPDTSCATNRQYLEETLGAERIWAVPYLGRRPLSARGLAKVCRGGDWPSWAHMALDFCRRPVRARGRVL